MQESGEKTPSPALAPLEEAPAPVEAAIDAQVAREDSVADVDPTTTSLPPQPMRSPGVPVPPTLTVAGGLAVIGLLLMGAAERPASVGPMKSQAASIAMQQPAPAPGPSATEAPNKPDEPPPAPTWRVAHLSGDASIEIVEGAVGKRPVLAALSAAGLSRSEAHRVLKAFEKVKRLDRCGPKDTFTAARDKATGRVVAFELATSSTDVWQTREQEGALETARKLELHVERARKTAVVVVNEDLKAALAGAGLGTDQLLPLLDEALEGYAEPHDLKGGGRLRLVTTEEKIEGAPARLAELNAVEFVPPSGKAHRVYLLTKEGKNGAVKKLGFWDAKGRQPYRGAWRSPLAMARVSSRFNPQRMHPVLHVVMPHTGVDFAAAPGTPVYSCAPGVVRTVGDGGACGNMVQVQHANGLVSAYCHLSRFAAGLHGGQKIEARHLIGYVGQTGRATGPHLHFAVKRGETFIDPLSLKLDGFRLVPRQDKETFAELRAQLDEALDSIPLPGGAPVPAADDDAVPDATDDH